MVELVNKMDKNSLLKKILKGFYLNILTLKSCRFCKFNFMLNVQYTDITWTTFGISIHLFPFQIHSQSTKHSVYRENW